MSGSAHRGDHDVAFYEAAVEETIELSLSTAFTQTPDSNGPMTAGRWLIQLYNPGQNAICWVHEGIFVEGVPLAPSSPTSAGLRRIPLSIRSVIAFETHVLPNYSDRIGAILTQGTALLWLTRVSTATRKRRR